MDVETVITGIVTLLTGGGLASIAFFRERKKAEQLKNDALASEQWQKLFERSDQDNRDKDKKIDKLYEDLGRFRDENNNLTTENAVLKLKKCEVIGCINRQPPTGL